MLQGETIKELLSSTAEKQNITVCGWVRTARTSPGLTFVAISDGTCFDTLQVVYENSDGKPEIKVNTGACIKATGNLIESPGKGQKWEIKADSLEIIGDADSSYPFQKKRHSFEFLRSIAHLRVRGNAFGAAFRIRNRTSYAIHRFFQERGFLWVHSPIITTSDCEGAGEMFTLTTFDIADPPKKDDGSVDYSKDFFGERAGLTVSGQLEAEVFAMAFRNVYTFGPTFRAENSNTPRHVAEFWMIEPEMAFYDLDDNRRLAEEMLKFVIRDVADYCADDIEFLNKFVHKGLKDEIRQVLEADFVHITYTEAIDLLVNSGKTFEYPVSWGTDLQTEHERWLSEEHFKRPVFVTDYPSSIKPFYMRVNDDGKTVRAMDCLFPRIGEIIGGSQREERQDILFKRMEELGISKEDYFWYTDLRRYGSAPHSGFGLGFERLLMFLTGMSNIRDVLPFPRTPGNAKF